MATKTRLRPITPADMFIIEDDTGKIIGIQSDPRTPSSNLVLGDVDAVTGGIGFLLPDGGVRDASGSALQINRAASRYKGKTGGRLIAFCDSETLGLGSTNTETKSFRGLLNTKYATALGTKLNLAVSGALPGSYFNNSSNAPDYSLAAGDVVFGQFGLNCIINNGGAPVNSLYLKDCLQSFMSSLAWFALPESAKVRVHLVGSSAPNPSVTFAGAWTHNYAVYSRIASYGNGAGTSSATFTTPAGDMVYVWLYRGSSASGAVTVTIDGVDYFADTGGLSYAQTAGGFEPCLFRFAVPYAQSHSVTLALTSGNYVFTCGVAAFRCTTVDGPTVLTLLPTDLPQAGYTLQPKFSLASLSGNGSIATATTTVPHKLQTGDNVTISGSSVGGYNVTAAATVTSSKSFTYANATTGAQSGAVFQTPDTAIGNTYSGTEALQQLNAVTRQAVANLYADGLNVVTVEAPINFNPLIHVVGNSQSDQVHTNDKGHTEKAAVLGKFIDHLLGIVSA